MIKTLSDEDLAQLLGLLRGANSVELKLTVPENAQNRVLGALGVDPLDARLRQVFFFDTPELTLSKKGVVVRARRIQDAGADTTVKLRPVSCGTTPPSPPRLGPGSSPSSGVHR